MKNETITIIESLDLEIARLNTIGKISALAAQALAVLGVVGSVLFWI